MLPATRWLPQMLKITKKDLPVSKKKPLVFGSFDKPSGPIPNAAQAKDGVICNVSPE